MTTTETQQNTSLTDVKRPFEYNHYNGYSFEEAWKVLKEKCKNPINPSKQIEMVCYPDGNIRVYTVV